MKNTQLYSSVKQVLDNYQVKTPLLGISNSNREETFIRQICDSIRRIEYIDVIKQRNVSPDRANPNNAIFDPLRGAIWHLQNGDINEACWLIFLFTHFGKHLRTNYALCKNFYGGLNSTNIWTWSNTTNDIAGMKLWLQSNKHLIKNDVYFGNHRKYQSLDAYKSSGTGATIESYVNLIGNDHNQFFNNVNNSVRNDKGLFFDYLYKLFSKNIIGFGRLAIFDYLTMIGKVGIINIEPNSPYIQNATGPKDGTKVLFDTPNATKNDLNDYLQDLAKALNRPFSMQILEDAVCNWQKQPDMYRYFKG